MKKFMFTMTLVSWMMLDLMTKNFALKYFQKKVNLLGDFLYLEYNLNKWMAFSIELNSILLKMLTMVLIIWFFYYYLLEESKKKIFCMDLAFWLMLAWALWNAMESMFKGEVMDFIWVKYFSVFNLADSFMTIWAVLYMAVILFMPVKK